MLALVISMSFCRMLLDYGYYRIRREFYSRIVTIGNLAKEYIVVAILKIKRTRESFVFEKLAATVSQII